MVARQAAGRVDVTAIWLYRGEVFRGRYSRYGWRSEGNGESCFIGEWRGREMQQVGAVGTISDRLEAPPGLAAAAAGLLGNRCVCRL